MTYLIQNFHDICLSYVFKLMCNLLKLDNICSVQCIAIKEDIVDQVDRTLAYYPPPPKSAWFKVYNAIFNNMSIISWLSVLLMEETGVPRKNHQPIESHWQTLSHNIVSSTLKTNIFLFLHNKKNRTTHCLIYIYIIYDIIIYI